MPMKKIPVTLLLILINGLVFSWMAFRLQNVLFNRNQDFLYILANGSNFNPFTVRGEYWRLFTSMFIHWGIVHLTVNMYALYGIGKILERSLGPSRFILLYMIAGLTAGLSSLFFNVYVISAGASGAIFGLYGYLIIQQVSDNFSNRKALGGVAFNFVVFVAVNYAIARSINVDTAGHLGGFLSGAAISLLNSFGLFHRLSRQVFLLIALPVVSLAVPKDQLDYYRVYNKVTKADDRLESVNNQLMPDHLRGDSLQKILPDFDSALSELRQLPHVPIELAVDTMVIKRYTAYRIKEVNYLLLGIELETFVYLDSIELINAKMDSLPQLKYHLNYDAYSLLANEDILDRLPKTQAEWTKVYYDSSWREIPGPGGAHFFRLGQRDSLQRWQGDVRDFYIDGKIQMKGTYLNDMHDGVFRYYSRQGKYESLGRYDKERPVGKWENFHTAGQLESEVYYGNGSFTKSVYDSLGNQQVTNGNGKQITWYANGKIREEGSYVDGQKNGNWFGYYATGKAHYQEYYRKGKLIRGVALSEKGERFVYDQLSVFPFPKMGMQAYKEYLTHNLRRPQDSRIHQGTVKLTFLVDTDGSMRDFVVIQSVDVGCDREAIRLVREGPAWRPGVLRGHINTLSSGYVEVHF
jgi:membrane associated rhomboid family serine protease